MYRPVGLMQGIVGRPTSTTCTQYSSHRTECMLSCQKVRYISSCFSSSCFLYFFLLISFGHWFYIYMYMSLGMQVSKSADTRRAGGGGGGGGVLLYRRYMGTCRPNGSGFHWRNPLGPYFSRKILTDGSPFWVSCVRTYFASIPHEIIPEIITPMIPPITQEYGEGWGKYRLEVQRKSPCINMPRY